MKTIECDLLIIGGGETGIRAAVEARQKGVQNVLLTCKGKFGDSGAMFSQLINGWDIQVATGENDPSDSTDVHYEDIMTAAQGTCNPRLARILVDEAEDRLKDLIDIYGLKLARWDSGGRIQVKSCFSSKARAYRIHNPSFIKKMMTQCLLNSGTRVMDNTQIIELIVNDGICSGAIGVGINGEFVLIKAMAVILATGGGAALFKHNFASEGTYGDGYALAIRAGCSLANMEFIQFGLGLLTPKYRFVLLGRELYLNPIVEFSQNHLFTCDMRKIMKDRAIHFPFSCSDDSYQLDIAIFKESLLNNGKGVAINYSNIEFSKLYSISEWRTWYEWFDKEHNPYDNKMTVVPFAHAFNGGIIIDEDTRTGIDGLFAAGETVTGPHGADRLGGNMHTACGVFGIRAARSAEKYIANRKKLVANSSEPFIDSHHEVVSYMDYCEILNSLKTLMWENVNVLRNEINMVNALKKVREVKVQLESHRPSNNVYRWHYYELRNALLVCETVLSAAIERDESRGSHYREDFPNKCEEAYIIINRYLNDSVHSVKSASF